MEGKYLLEELPDSKFNAYQSAINDVAIIAITDVKGNIIHVNQKFCDISGYTEQELLGQNHRILKSGDHSIEFFRKLWREIANGNTWRGEIKNRNKNGEYYWVDTIIVPILNEFNKPYQYLALRFDITKKKAHEDQLQKAKNEQTHLNNFKTKLIYTLSHDVKSPFKSLKGLTSLLEKEQFSRTEFQQCVEKVGRKIDEVEKVLDDLILSAENNYSSTKQNEQIDFYEIINGSMKIFEQKISKKKLSLRTKVNLQSPVSTKKDLIRIILRNLISNAIQYSYPEGTIDITVSEMNEFEAVYITVRDYGPGMSYEIIESILSGNMVYRSRENGDCGSGIGLTLSRQFIDDLGGRFILESEVGKGSTVGFSIPS